MKRPNRRDGRLLVRVLVMASTAIALLAFSATAQAAFVVTGFENDVVNADGTAATAAGGHPYKVVTTVTFNSHLGKWGSAPEESVKDIEVELPVGFSGSTTAVPKCAAEDLYREGAVVLCPNDTQVGILIPEFEFPGAPKVKPVPIYNMETPDGVPARFGANILGVIVYFDARVRSGGDYGITMVSRNINQTLALLRVTTELWGVPADPSHDIQRCQKVGETVDALCESLAGDREAPHVSGVTPKPLLTNVSDCSAGPFVTKVKADSWTSPGVWSTATDTLEESGSPVSVSGCERVPFQPTVTISPESREAGAPTGLAVSISIPGSGLENPQGIAQSPLKDATVTFPAGMTVNASSADGLLGCSEADAKLGSAEPASCPAASQVGTVSIKTPLLENPLQGSVYLATQGTNPFKSLIALYISVDDPTTGIVLKIPGQVSLNPQTGQLTASFREAPQLPFSEFSMRLKGGNRAALVNPPSCGTYTTDARLAGWSNPGEPTSSRSSFTIDQGCSGKGGFSPGFEAGTVNPVAGSYSPFSLRVTRTEGEQNLAAIQAALPGGLLAKLAGVPLCPDAQAASGDCPSGSQVGRVTVGVGAGSNPIYVPQASKTPTAVYLAGPYQGAPYSLVVKVPAQAGPFDLGTVAVRNALYIDPVTTQVTTKSDPLPQILQGIPITYRDVRVEIDRPEFTVNPTSCDPTQVGGTIGSAAGASVNVSSRFQAVDCEALGFTPKVALRLSGAPPRRGANPALQATVTPASGNANIGKASVILPATELLEQGHIKTVCTRVQFAAGQCPAGSIYGHAKAWTPLLDQPLEGPVYLRSNGGERKLPDLVADLNGQIHVVLVGYIDSVKRHGSPRIRTRFLEVPDAPVSKFVLEMQKGKKSLLANNTNLCKAKPRAEVTLGGQNGKESESQPLVKVDGCGGKKSKGGKQGK